MMRRWLTLVLGSGLLATVSAGCSPLASGRYPDGDIRLTVAAEAGEIPDTVARAVAPCLGERLGTGVIVENRPGGRGVVGTREFLEGADPGGYTLLVAGSGPAVVAPKVLPEVDYKPEDFLFVGLMRSAPMILFSAGNGPVDTAEHLFATARTAKRPVEVAATGAAMTEALAVLEINAVKETRLKYRRLGSDTEVLRGVVDGTYPAGLATVTADHLARIKSGEITVLAVGGELPPSYLRHAPTVFGVLRDDTVLRHPTDTLLIAPDTVPDRVYGRLADTLERCMNDGDVRRGIGVDFVPDELMAHGDLRGRYFRLDRSIQRAYYREHE